MAKSSRPRKKMDAYFKNLEKNTHCLNHNRKGFSHTKTQDWNIFRKLTEEVYEDEKEQDNIPPKKSIPAAQLLPRKDVHLEKKGEKEPDKLAPKKHIPAAQLLPRKDVSLYGRIPAMEQRVYSKCKNCCRVFNPKDISSHRTCSKIQNPYSSLLLKKKVKSRNGSNNGKKTNSNGNSTSTNIVSPLGISISSPSLLDPTKEFEFKKPYAPPPIKASAATTDDSVVIDDEAADSPQLKVSVAKISTPVTVSSTPSLTTSSNKADSKASSKVTTSAHHSPRNPGRHGSKSSSVHSLGNSSSSSGHHASRTSSSSHYSPKNQSLSSSHHRSRSPSRVHHNTKMTLKSSSSHHGNSHHSSSHHSSKSTSSKDTPMDTLPASSSTSHHHHSTLSHSSSSNSNSRHKKSSSSSSKRSSSGSSSNSSSKMSPKNYDPDIHCGVVDEDRGPCMRSITCSNHRLNLRKQVSGRSKDIHQLIAERKAAKENDLKHRTISRSYASPNGEAKEISQNTSYVPVAAKVASTNTNLVITNSFVPILSTVQTKFSTVSVLSKKAAVAETQKYMLCTKALENTQVNAVRRVPVVIMPVNPVSVVGSVQLVKIGNNVISLVSPQSAPTSPARRRIIIPVQNHNTYLRMYKSHPKPISQPNFGIRKLGGALLLANPLVDDQRNDLVSTIDFQLDTVNTERGLSGLNHTNSPNRSNVLKGIKRPATDILPTSDSKRHSDVNGFILHADISESTEAPPFQGENGKSQHELIISLIDKHKF